MFSYTEKKSRIVSIIIACAVVAMMVLQFMPYWNYNKAEKTIYDDKNVLAADLLVEREKEAAHNALRETNPELPKYERNVIRLSVQGYTWLCFNHTDLTGIFEDEYVDGFTVNQIVGMPILSLVAAVLVVFFAIRRGDSPLLFGAFSLVSGGATEYMLFSSKVFEITFSIRICLMAASAVVILLAIFSLVLGIKKLIRKNR